MKFVRAVSFAVLSSAALAGCTSDLASPTEVPADDASYALNGVSVGSVEITPSKVTVAPGAKVTLTAVVKDTNGKVTSRGVSWSTSDRSIARVTTAGVVLGEKVGTVTITAVSSGKTGTAIVTVGTGGSVGGTTTPAPTPDPTPTPAPTPEPTPAPSPTPSKGVVFRDDFEGGVRTAAQNGYKWVGGSSGIAVSSALARSGRYSMEFLYPGKGLCEDASKEQRFQLGDDLTEVWLEYYIYLPKGGENGSARYYHRSPVCPEKKDPNGVTNNNKFFALWGETYSPTDNKVLFEYRRSAKGKDGDSYLYGMWCNDTTSCSNRNWANGTWDPAFTDAMRGRWTQIRIHAKLADSKGAANGMLQLWADGALKIDMHNIPLAPDSPAKRFFRNGYLMGWSNSGFNEDTSIFLDDFSIFASNPGW